MDQATDARAEQTGSTPGPRRGELPLSDHILMVNDLARGEKYLEAMHAKIRPGDIVLEVGTGAGLLTCMAVRLGAKHVYTVERSPALYAVAQKVFAANGLSDKITLVHAGSEELRALGVVREPVDVFVTETIGALGLEEGIAPVFEHVRPLLAPNARVIPENVRFKQCLVNMTGVRERVEIFQPVFGFDLSALNTESPSNQFLWLNVIEPWREVSTIAETPAYDLMSFAPGQSRHEMLLYTDNVCDGMLTWSEFKLADQIVIETRYRQVNDTWANCIHFMKRTKVAYGQRCNSEFRIHDDKVTWTTTWTIGPA